MAGRTRLRSDPSNFQLPTTPLQFPFILSADTRIELIANNNYKRMGPRRRASGGSGRRQLFLLLIALLIALLCFFTLTVDAAAKKKGKGKSSGKKASSKEGGSSGSSDSSEKKIKIPKLKTNLKGLAKCPKAVSRGEDIAPVTSLYLNPPKPNAGSSFTWNATLTVTKVITDGVEMRMRAEKDGKKLSEDVMWVDPASR